MHSSSSTRVAENRTWSVAKSHLESRFAIEKNGRLNFKFGRVRHFSEYKQSVCWLFLRFLLSKLGIYYCGFGLFYFQVNYMTTAPNLFPFRLQGCRIGMPF